ncbi:hypothetical protein B6N60_03977 [Richelia sinica FACHB-800]|uniref:DUF2834 domain-containing protein n=1 Tax=Richelia sinica FACHB-800 TaxID=1357546 RepID=A0A975TAK9_9NOST|nr:DUF2834 domain-containing protein [Richelia sinica]MBD2666646.1 DUF2834 domain-containing protein [Richelia sinica FACHB-800]QXE25263.1 hypothetical protein B6N60_03977 [Richelia sinica FACHB-800]
MVRKIGFGLIWLGFITYAFLFAPPNDPNTSELIKNMLVFQWEGINPLVIALFNLLGIWALIYTAVILMDGRGQKVRAWPFAIASVGVGAFAILPYLALRDPNPQFEGKKSLLIKILDSHLTGMAAALIAGALIVYGLQGDWANFVQQWHSSRFIHVMSLDFCMLGLIFPSLLGDDMARRGWKNHQLFWLFALIPFFGPLVYLSVRPPLPDTEIKN